VRNVNKYVTGIYSFKCGTLAVILIPFVATSLQLANTPAIVLRRVGTEKHDVPFLLNHLSCTLQEMNMRCFQGCGAGTQISGSDSGSSDLKVFGPSFSSNI